jgi:hypothetical protein
LQGVFDFPTKTMNNVQNYTDKQILDRVRSLPSFKGFPAGVMDVWIRSDEDAFDKFDDKVYTYECFGDDKPPRFIMVCTGTSNAGAEGLRHFAKYNGLGCAVLKSEVIVYNSHAYGLHKGNPQHPAYRQVKPFPYFRDNDKDNRTEEIGIEYNEIIGANCHRAGWFSTNIGGWSVACLVRNQRAQYDKWLKFMNRRKLSVCILKEWNPATFKNLRAEDINLEIPKSPSTDEPSSPIGSSAGVTPPADAVDEPDSKDSAQNSADTQIADAIVNVGTGEKLTVPENFTPKDIPLPAPEKDGATDKAATMTIAGIAVPAFLVALVRFVQDSINQGFLDARQVGDVVVNLITNNLKFVFILIALIIVILIIKKIFKQLSYMLQMYLTARPDFHNPKIIPNIRAEEPTDELSIWHRIKILLGWRA